MDFQAVMSVSEILLTGKMALTPKGEDESRQYSHIPTGLEDCNKNAGGYGSFLPKMASSSWPSLQHKEHSDEYKSRRFHVSCYGTLHEDGCIRSSYDGSILLEQLVFEAPTESNSPAHPWGSDNVVTFMHGSVLCNYCLMVNAYFELKHKVPIQDVKQVLMQHLGCTATIKKLELDGCTSDTPEQMQHAAYFLPKVTRNIEVSSTFTHGRLSREVADVYKKEIAPRIFKHGQGFRISVARSIVRDAY
jgi:hypothetical protein